MYKNVHKYHGEFQYLCQTYPHSFQVFYRQDGHKQSIPEKIINIATNRNGAQDTSLYAGHEYR